MCIDTVLPRDVGLRRLYQRNYGLYHAMAMAIFGDGVRNGVRSPYSRIDDYRLLPNTMTCSVIGSLSLGVCQHNLVRL